MKTKYEWMNDGKEFELPNILEMNPQNQIDMLYIRAKAEKKYEGIKPKGIRPKQKDLNEDWTLYLNFVGIQYNIDTVVYALQVVDPSLTKETILEHFKDNKDFAEMINLLFRVGTKPQKKKTGARQKSKS